MASYKVVSYPTGPKGCLVGTKADGKTKVTYGTAVYASRTTADGGYPSKTYDSQVNSAAPPSADAGTKGTCSISPTKLGSNTSSKTGSETITFNYYSDEGSAGVLKGTETTSRGTTTTYSWPDTGSNLSKSTTIKVSTTTQVVTGQETYLGYIYPKITSPEKLTVNEKATVSRKAYTKSGGLATYTAAGVSKTGYTFKKGKCETSNSRYNGNTYSSGSSGSVSAGYDAGVTPYRLSATGTPITYSVRYNPNGGAGTMDNSDHTYDTAKNLSANAFTKTGYILSGWDTSSTGTTVVYTPGESVKNLTTVAGAIVDLYAVGSPITYYIKYNPNGGTGTMANSTHYYNTAKNLSTNAFSKTGYSFIGGDTNSAGSTVVYTPGVSVINLTTVNGTTINLYAVGSANNYIVTANPNSGTISNLNGGTASGANAIKSLSYGSQLSTLPTVTRTAYNLSGWYDTSAASGGTQYTTSTTITNTKTIYARGSPISYTATFVPNGGTWSDNTAVNKSSTYNITSVLAAPLSISRVGYNFAGGKVTTAGGNGTSGSTYTSTSTTTLEGVSGKYGTVTFTAQGSDKPITITLDANGGTIPSGGMTSVVINYNTTAANYPSIGTLPVRTGYTFNGYCDASSGGVQYYTAAGAGARVFDKSANTKFYAHGNLQKYTITYNLNGGTVSGNPTEYYITTSTFTLKNPTMQDQEFMGWTGTGASSPTMTITIPTGSTGNRSYTANGKPDANCYVRINGTGKKVKEIHVSIDGTGKKVSNGQACINGTGRQGI